MSAERSTLHTAYAMIDRHLAASRTWISTGGFSMADCAAAPALFYASTIEPFPQGMGHLADYFDRIVQRPSFRKVVDEARPYFPMYPFADAIPARFRDA
jgi:glutathione S-transferase